MGIILGKFRRKKTTLETLENVENEIKYIEDYRRDTEQTQKKIVGRFVVISVGAYLLTASLFYFYFFPANFYDQIFYIIPLIFAPVIIITVKRGLTWYYRRKISQKQDKLLSLREEKKRLLDKVKETETYKVAKHILDKYAPENQVSTHRNIGMYENSKTPGKKETPMPPETILRQRALPAPISQIPPFITPIRPSMQPSVRLAIQGIPNQPLTGPTEALLPLPRDILPKDRSVLDKMVDYLMGDGPTNRYALICKNCCSHNGMAHKDEFEYVSFKCCYCFAMNPARKKRPGGPKLDFDLKVPSSLNQSDASESEKSPSESESELEHNDEKSLPEAETKIESVQPESIEVETKALETTMISEEKLNNCTPIMEEVEHKEPPLVTADL